MRTMKTAALALAFTLVLVLSALGTPFPVLAEESANTTASNATAGINEDKTGPKKPPGPDGNTYKFNESTGLWENDHYTWNPATQQTAPKQSSDYSYNPETKMWDTTSWAYNAATGKYEANTKSTTTTSPTESTKDKKQDSTGAPQELEPDKTAQSASISGTPSEPGQAENQHPGNGSFDLFYDADISHNLESTATSGNATVAKNTTGGDAISGDALSVANVFNLLQSSWSTLHDEGFVSFISNIFGDVIGDLMIDPNALSQAVNSSTKANDISVNVAGSSSINNNIDLSATSGNATVQNNTSGGNASSGSATALANVVNMINSFIGSGKSFLGLVNIYGNLDGDILMPEEFIRNLLASNAPSTTMDTSKLSNPESLAAFTDNQSIQNTASTSANSGSAEVIHNTTAGNATTGGASTNLTVFNLTGRTVIGKDSLLVFVNVLGEWIGMIINAPNSTAAALGDSSTTSIGSSPPLNSGAATSVNNASITNNITVAATSGKASVTGNTSAGNATSGDASASINIANITNSTLSLSDWFGILFINVFGSWHGSFGIDTANGNPASMTGVPGATVTTASAPTPQVFRFISNNSTYSAVQTSYTPEVRSEILAATQENPVPNNDTPSYLGGVNIPTDPPVSLATQSKNLWLPIVGTVLGALLFGTERLLGILQRKRLVNTI